jgi:pimeloyl-ACP methyl ester carboxylesterase
MAPQSGQDFEPFMALAGQERLVIAPDYPGYGDSDPIKGEAEVSIEAYAKSMWEALDALNVKNVEILGYHTGSKVGIEMALQSPARVSTLICISLSTMTPEQYAAKQPSFKPLSNQETNDAFPGWWKTLRGYYDDMLPYDVLVQKYATSIKSGPRFHLGFQASYQYNAVVIEKLKALKTLTVIINPNDDLKEVTPLAVNYIENAVLVEKEQWLPGFLDIRPQEVLEIVNSVAGLLTERPTTS